MSLAAKIKMKKLEQLKAAQAAAAAQHEQAEAVRAERQSARRAQPFDQDKLVEVAAVHAPSVSAAAITRQRKAARLAVENDGAAGLAPDRSADGEGASDYELLLAALGEDEAALKRLSGNSRREAMKADLIGKYDPHVDATLAAAVDTGTAVQDEIVAMMLIWRFDIGDWERGLDIAEHMLRHGLRLPVMKNFQRTPATIIAEQVAEAALTADKVGKDFDLKHLHRAMQLTADFDMPDQVRAKIAKAAALHILREAAKADDDADAVADGKPVAARTMALDLLRRAIELDKGSGVVKHIERTESWLKKNGGVVDDDKANANADPAGAGDNPPPAEQV